MDTYTILQLHGALLQCIYNTWKKSNICKCDDVWVPTYMPFPVSAPGEYVHK